MLLYIDDFSNFDVVYVFSGIDYFFDFEADSEKFCRKLFGGGVDVYKIF